MGVPPFQEWRAIMDNTSHAEQLRALEGLAGACRADRELEDFLRRDLDTFDEALRKVWSALTRRAELESEKGKLLYSYDIKVPGKSGVEEVQVDALTGAVIAHEHETPKAEAAEKKAEKKPAAKTAPAATKKP